MSFIKGLYDVENSIKLTKFEGKGLEVSPTESLAVLKPSSPRMRICFLDLETTGTDRKEDKIIEIALKCVELTKNNGQDIAIVDAYESFQDPGVPIPDSASKINQITDDMVKDHNIDWEKVQSIFEKSQLIVAHNAYFDRAFMDRALDISKNKIWACSIHDINWQEKKFNSNKLELLCIWHGFYYASHRAMIDVDALIYLLTHSSYVDDKPIVELIEHAKIPLCRVDATFAPFEYKNLLKKRSYRWYDPENGNRNDKCWRKYIKHEEIEEEEKWLNENIYNNKFKGRFVEITIIDKYKDN